MLAAGSRAVRLADYPPAAVFGPRRMLDYEFVWLLRGSAVWTVGDADDRRPADRQYLLRPGTLALARPGTVDSYQWDTERPSTHAYVHFALDADPAASRDWPAIRSLTVLPVLDGICHYLLQLAADPSPGSDTRRDQLLGLMADIFVDGPVPRADPGLPQIIITIADQVRTDWDRNGIRPVAVDVLAAAAGVSSGHLHRLFRRWFGLGPSRALELVRLARAAATLQRSNSTIAEVAELTGFANPYHFSRRFSGTYGQPPGSYRQSTDPVDPLAPLQNAGLVQLSYLLG